MASVCKEIPVAVKECKGVETNLERLIAAIKTFEHPIDFIYHIEKDLQINGV